jgi:hypothetical protein
LDSVKSVARDEDPLPQEEANPHILPLVHEGFRNDVPDQQMQYNVAADQGMSALVADQGGNVAPVVAMEPFELGTPPTNEALSFPTAEQDLVAINHFTGMIADLMGNDDC